MSWAQERRADRAEQAEQARRDADAASERRLREQAAATERREQAQRARRERDDDAATARRARRARRWTALARWAGDHRVDLLIYPLAVASAVLAVPSMAVYGATVYRGPVGVVLPVLSELGMWAFAFAVAARRRRAPDAPVWALQVGVWTFAAVAAGLNLLHGLDTGGVGSGVVMAIVSVAGVAAHQLVTAGRLRSRSERHLDRVARRVERRIAAAERAAARAGVAEIDQHGRARLVVVPGRYQLRRGRLVPALVAGLPVTDAVGLGDELAGEIADWLNAEPGPGTRNREGDDAGPGDDERPDGAGVATLDPPPTGMVPPPRTRSMDELRAQFRAALADRRVDPGSAESIRTTLRCSPARARQLRDEHARSGGDQR